MPVFVYALTFISLVHLVEKLLGLSFQLRVSMLVRVVEHAQPPVGSLQLLLGGL